MKKILAIFVACAMVFMALPQQAHADDVPIVDDFWQVAVGGGHILALRQDGTLWAWGNNAQGQIGNRGSSDASNTQGTPCQIEPTLIMEDVKLIAAGDAHSLALSEDGTLWGWGDNTYGQLGNQGQGNKLQEDLSTGQDGSDVHYYYQTTPMKIADDVQTVSAGSYFTLFLKTDGTLWSCGDNTQGQLGNGGLGNSMEPIYFAPTQTEPVQILDTVTAVSAGFTHALALKEDGTLWGWGDNSSNQVGNNGSGDQEHERYGTYQSIPLQITLPLGESRGVTGISGGWNHSLAVTEEGWLFGWGATKLNDETAEGDTFGSPQRLLESVQTPIGGDYGVFALKFDRTLWGWGTNLEKGLHYDYADMAELSTPHQIMEGVNQAAHRYGNTFAVLQDGSLYGWGANDTGQLAQPLNSTLRQPVRVEVEYPPVLPSLEEEPEPEPDPQPAPEPLPENQPLNNPSPLPYILGGIAAAVALGGGGYYAWRKTHPKTPTNLQHEDVTNAARNLAGLDAAATTGRPQIDTPEAKALPGAERASYPEDAPVIDIETSAAETIEATPSNTAMEEAVPEENTLPTQEELPAPEDSGAAIEHTEETAPKSPKEHPQKPPENNRTNKKKRR